MKRISLIIVAGIVMAIASPLALIEVNEWGIAMSKEGSDEGAILWLFAYGISGAMGIAGGTIILMTLCNFLMKIFSKQTS